MADNEYTKPSRAKDPSDSTAAANAAPPSKLFKFAEQLVAVSLLLGFVGACVYSNQKERIDPYIQPLFSPQHRDVVYAVVCGSVCATILPRPWCALGRGTAQ